MAAKDNTIKLGLICTICGNRNYLTTKNKIENTAKIELNKYCRHCRKHTKHKEDSKLK